MTQIGAGLEWTNGSLILFATPNLQYVFKEFDRDTPSYIAFLVPALNSGARWRF